MERPCLVQIYSANLNDNLYMPNFRISWYHSLGLLEDGTVLAWGCNIHGKRWYPNR